MYCTCHAHYASCMFVHVFSGACGVCMCIWYMWCMYICTGHVYLVVYVCVCGWCMIVYVFDGACDVYVHVYHTCMVHVFTGHVYLVVYVCVYYECMVHVVHVYIYMLCTSVIVNVKL